MKEIYYHIIISVIIIILIGIACFLCLTWMGEKINSDCQKQGNVGVIHYWDADISCPEYLSGVVNITR